MYSFFVTQPQDNNSDTYNNLYTPSKLVQRPTACRASNCFGSTGGEVDGEGMEWGSEELEEQGADQEVLGAQGARGSGDNWGQPLREQRSLTWQ